MTINELLGASGMTVTELSKYCNIPYRTVFNWVNEGRKVPAYVLELIEYKLRHEGKLQ